MKKALIIGSSESSRRLVQLTPQFEALAVQTAEDGYAAIEIIEALHPDLLLTEMSMLGDNAIEVLRHLKELSPETELIVFVDAADVDLGIQALRLGASDFVIQPVRAEALEVAIERAKEKLWMRDKLQEAIEEIEKRHDFAHKLILTSMDGIIANDRKGNIIIFNEGASRIYGYSPDEALTQLHVTDLYPEGVARTIKKMIYSAEYGGPGRLINYEASALTKDKRLVPIVLSATLIYEENVEVATVGYFKDLALA